VLQRLFMLSVTRFDLTQLFQIFLESMPPDFLEGSVAVCEDCTFESASSHYSTV